jgi:signal recognition particle receptor subunit beta
VRPAEAQQHPPSSFSAPAALARPPYSLSYVPLSFTTHTSLLTTALKLQCRSAQPSTSTSTSTVSPTQTRTSQTPQTARLLLPSSIALGSNRYRSQNDSAALSTSATPYNLIDTPGHGKLRSSSALSYLLEPLLRGIIFVVDSASLDSGDASIARDTAAYLHDALLALQRRKTGKGGSKAKAEIKVLVAANKQDLFTALPQGAVRERLEAEIDRVRLSRRKGLVTVGEDESAEVESEDVLGGDGEEKFTFGLLRQEYGIEVDVLGGAVKGEEAGKGVRRWEEWIGGCL